LRTEAKLHDGTIALCWRSREPPPCATGDARERLARAASRFTVTDKVNEIWGTDSRLKIPQVSCLPAFQSMRWKAGRRTDSSMLLLLAGREGAVIKLGELIMILELHRQGVSVSAIARQLGIDRKTVRTHIAKGLTAPAYTPRPLRMRLIGRFIPYCAGGSLHSRP
jgi:hypothetical protein